jgi:Ca2+-binding EF-hand superfamily protein
MDGQREVDQEGLQVVLDEAGINNTKTQRQQFYKLLDSDNDAMISYKELETYIDNYNPDKGIATNMMDKGLQNGNMLGMLKEVCEL